MKLAPRTATVSRNTKETQIFWKNLFSAMKINTSGLVGNSEETKQKPHNLLLDGPVD